MHIFLRACGECFVFSEMFSLSLCIRQRGDDEKKCSKYWRKFQLSPLFVSEWMNWMISQWLGDTSPFVWRLKSAIERHCKIVLKSHLMYVTCYKIYHLRGSWGDKLSSPLCDGTFVLQNNAKIGISCRLASMIQLWLVKWVEHNRALRLRYGLTYKLMSGHWKLLLFKNQ